MSIQQGFSSLYPFSQKRFGSLIFLCAWGFGIWNNFSQHLAALWNNKPIPDITLNPHSPQSNSENSFSLSDPWALASSLHKIFTPLHFLACNRHHPESPCLAGLLQAEFPLGLHLGPGNAHSYRPAPTSLCIWTAPAFTDLFLHLFQLLFFSRISVLNNLEYAILITW